MVDLREHLKGISKNGGKSSWAKLSKEGKKARLKRMHEGRAKQRLAKKNAQA